MPRSQSAVVLALLITPVLAGCTTPAPSPGQATCPDGADGFLAIAIQEGGLSPHPEVFTVEPDGRTTGIVLAHGQPEEGETVGIPERALHNITRDEILRILDAADQPDEGRWNVTLAFQGTASSADLDAICTALEETAPKLQANYPDEDCRDGTTLTLRLWTPTGIVVSQAACEGGASTAFETVRLTLRNATLTARDQAGAPS